MKLFNIFPDEARTFMPDAGMAIRAAANRCGSIRDLASGARGAAARVIT
ncbi:hypothetical protein [Citreimonas salinaria]|nr:hypothetical protein [Citreimonas salinaria]